MLEYLIFCEKPKKLPLSASNIHTITGKSRLCANGKISVEARGLIKNLRSKMEDIDLKVFSLNCNGLHDNVKRTVTMQKLKKQGPGIYLLQETHSTSQQEFAWATTWGCRAIFFAWNVQFAGSSRIDYV